MLPTSMPTTKSTRERVVLPVAPGDRADERSEQKCPADDHESDQTPSEPGKKAGKPEAGDVPYLGQSLLSGLGDALGTINQSDHADDESEHAAMQTGAARARIELRADDEETASRAS